jgi:hypothetical protein
MSFVNSMLANSVGVFWSAASGTVDPFTKANLQEEEAASLQQASGGTMTAADATSQATADVQTVLIQAGADPSQFLDGLKRSLSSATTSSLLVVGGVVAILAAIFLIKGMFRE